MTVAWINVAVLIVCAFAILVLYVRSASPAAQEKLTGSPRAYARCAFMRRLSCIPMALTCVCFVVYRLYPLPVPLPENFPWSWWVSFGLALLIMVPSGVVMWAGYRAAGEEAMTPKKEHGLYGGIYRRMRHPQAYEVLFWFAFALVLHSPFLFLFSFLYLPVWYLMVEAEERDLVIRYGDAYTDYHRRTGAFLPKLGKGGGAARG